MGLTVLVVDDDPNTVRLIEDSIPWSENQTATGDIPDLS